MNNLVKQEYFQIMLNQFLAIDEDLISWKLTCRYCYYHIHFIYVMKTVPIHIYKYTIPVVIDTTNYVTSIPTLNRKLCKCCLNMKLINTFNFDNITNLSHLKGLYLNYSADDIKLQKLTSLEVLDLGMYNYFTDHSFKKLKQLKVLYLQNNYDITADIFKYLPNLTTIQIGFDMYSRSYCSIRLNEVPEYVSTVICTYFDDIICPYDDECDPLYHIKKYTVYLRTPTDK